MSAWLLNSSEGLILLVFIFIGNVACPLAHAEKPIHPYSTD